MPIARTLSVVVTALAVAVGTAGQGRVAAESQPTVREALSAALDDERRALDTYRAVIAVYGDVRPFNNIVKAEERHIQALVRQFRAQKLAVPPAPPPPTITVGKTLQEACRAAVTAERQNARLYEGLIAATAGYPEVQETFRRLQAASTERHLPAFQRCAEGRRGGPGRPRQ